MGTYVIMRVWRGNPRHTTYRGTVSASSAAKAEDLAERKWPNDVNHYYDAYHVDSEAEEIERLCSLSELIDAGWPS